MLRVKISAYYFSFCHSMHSWFMNFINRLFIIHNWLLSPHFAINTTITKPQIKFSKCIEMHVKMRKSRTSFVWENEIIRLKWLGAPMTNVCCFCCGTWRNSYFNLVCVYRRGNWIQTHICHSLFKQRQRTKHIRPKRCVQYDFRCATTNPDFP